MSNPDIVLARLTALDERAPNPEFHPIAWIAQNPAGHDATLDALRALERERLVTHLGDRWRLTLPYERRGGEIAVDPKARPAAPVRVSREIVLNWFRSRDGEEGTAAELAADLDLPIRRVMDTCRQAKRDGMLEGSYRLTEAGYAYEPPSNRNKKQVRDFDRIAEWVEACNALDTGVAAGVHHTAITELLNGRKAGAGDGGISYAALLVAWGYFAQISPGYYRATGMEI